MAEPGSERPDKPALLDRWQPTPKEVVERQQWNGIVLTPEIETSWNRLSAVANILQNGAQTLTVFAMKPDVSYWGTASEINGGVKRLIGETLVSSGTTPGYLRSTLEPVGAAARSDTDERYWAATPFGIAIRPALIFGWQRMLYWGLNGSDVFGVTSQKTKTPEGTIITPVDIRLQIFDLLERRGTLRVSDITGSINVIAKPDVIDHLDRLASAGLITKEGLEPIKEKSQTKYLPTGRGKEVEEWPAYGVPHKYRSPAVERKLSGRVKEAVMSITTSGKQPTLDGILQFMHQQHGYTPDRSRVVAVLSFYEREGLIEYQQGFHARNRSKVELTRLGRVIKANVIDQLARWCEDPDSVPVIQEIDQRLKDNPEGFTDTFREIGESFKNSSIRIGENRAVLKMNFLRTIAQQSGTVATPDVARACAISPGIARIFTKELLQEGLIKEEPSILRGTRVLAYTGPDLEASTQH